MFGYKLKDKYACQAGYSLIELVVVIIILSIIGGVALKSVTMSTKTTRAEETKRELQLLADAIVGDPTQVANGSRLDYGYIGDVGALPPSLASLVSNTGGYTTWAGPYLVDEFSVSGNNQYLSDAWGVSYSYSGSTTIASTGGGTSISKYLASSTGDLLLNTLVVQVTDKGNSPPGSIYKDSVRLVLFQPNGLGSITQRIKTPDKNGWAMYDSIPIGLRELRVVYLPNNDTLRRVVGIDPASHRSISVSLWREVW